MIHRWKQYKMQIVFLKFQSHRQQSCRVINRLLLTNKSVAFPLLATSEHKSCTSLGNHSFPLSQLLAQISGIFYRAAKQTRCSQRLKLKLLFQGCFFFAINLSFIILQPVRSQSPVVVNDWTVRGHHLLRHNSRNESLY